MVAAADDRQPEAVHPVEGVSDASDASPETKLSPSVHFESTVQEISPAEPLPVGTVEDDSPAPPDGNIENGYDQERVTQDELRALTSSFRTAQLQGLRIASFAYEPMSLPASRTASHDESHHASRQHTPSSTVGSHSPMLVAKGHESQFHSPPLTPLATSHADADSKFSSPARSRHGTMTPQETARESSPLRARIAALRPSASDDVTVNNRPTSLSSSLPASRPTSRPASRPTSPPSEAHDHTPLGNHRQGMFSLGPASSGGGGSIGGPASGGSVPVSRESSVSEKASQFYSRPLTPSGDANDPYAANKRPPQNKIEPRFVFSRLTRKKDSAPNSPISLAKHKDDKRHSSFLGGHHHHHHKSDKEDSGGADESPANSIHSRQASMSDLKRFFKLGPAYHHKIKRAVSPAVSIRSARNDSTVTRANAQIPFGDEHTLTSKYGKLGKVLGSGAGGSVRLMKRSEDSTVFAVKEFRARHTYESEKEYAKKLTAEYCIGSSLHHGNIIETLDIINEKGKWYEVMEYAPYDLFAIVMTGRMTRPEVACCFLQILSGVTYLHSMGLAHRDLKLDNVVVSEHGIMKIIDFGSAHVFQYPFENGIVLASGIVGSDPYLAPEVYDERKYDPTAVDIWSLAIIFCCMTLRRFPWKVPRVTDNSYKLFAAEPSPGHNPMQLGPPKPASKEEKKEEKEEKKEEVKKEALADDKDKPVDKSDKPTDKPAEKKEVIKGPWRILRLLPRESRHVIGGMLKIDPAERIKMREILQDPWVANTIICRQTGPGRVVRASTHTHVLESPATPMKSG